MNPRAGKTTRCVYCGVRVRGKTCAKHRHLRLDRRLQFRGRCQYCGVKIPVTSATCFGHADLPALDPMRNPALSSAAERVNSEGGRSVAATLTSTERHDA